MIADRSDARERVDAASKVRGRADYTAERRPDGMVHAALVTSTIAHGRIAGFDLAAAEAVPGLVEIMTYRNAPRVSGAVTGRPGLDKFLLLMQDDRIAFDRQPVAVAIAGTFEAAVEAASRIAVRYEAAPAVANLDDPRLVADRPEKTPHDEPSDVARGDAAAARAAAAVVVSETYETPRHHHNAIELHATIAAWDGDDLTVWDATQGVFEVRRKLASVFGIAPERVRVISHFAGGGFGGKGSVWSHQPLAAMAARLCGRPVKLELSRDDVFGTTGHRPATSQHVVLGADATGKIVSIEHDVRATGSTFDTFLEASGEVTPHVYAIENYAVRHRLFRTNLNTPTFMRAPGEATGLFALECAVDELAYALDVDPLELRERNHADRDLYSDKPWSSKRLRECYARGAELAGWANRPRRPRSLREGRELIGLGMATGCYPAQVFKASAWVRLSADGSVLVRSGTQEIGQGSRTALAQIAASELGVDPGRVTLELGDTALPQAMNSGGSTTTASVGSAIALACRKIVRDRAQTPPPWLDRAFEAVAEYEGKDEREDYSGYSFAAQFARVRVDPDLGTVRLERMVGVFDVGRVVNARLARSQFVGGMTMGAGMALTERTRVDAHTARILNANLAEYHVPVNADIGEMIVETIDGYDEHVNPIGTKPVGEIGICGAPAAIANAVFHATGQRVRTLPIGNLRTLSRI